MSKPDKYRFIDARPAGMYHGTESPGFPEGNVFDITTS